MGLFFVKAVIHAVIGLYSEKHSMSCLRVAMRSSEEHQDHTSFQTSNDGCVDWGAGMVLQCQLDENASLTVALEAEDSSRVVRLIEIQLASEELLAFAERKSLMSAIPLPFNPQGDGASMSSFIVLTLFVDQSNCAPRPHVDQDPVTVEQKALSLPETMCQAADHLVNDAIRRGLPPSLKLNLNKAVELYNEAISLYPSDYPDLGITLNNLAVCHSARGDLQSSLETHERVLVLRPVGHSDRALTMINIGTTSKNLYDKTEDITHLERAIVHHRGALEVMSEDYPHRPMCLIELGKAYLDLYQSRNRWEDIELALQHYLDASQARPFGHADRSVALAGAAACFLLQYERSQDAPRFMSSVAYSRAATLWWDVHDPRRVDHMELTARAYQTRFNFTGNGTDLDHAIALRRQLLQLQPIGHPNHALRLNRLGTSVIARSRQRGNIADLDETIHLQTLSSVLGGGTTTRHGAMATMDLGAALMSRFERLGNMNDIDQSINHLSRAVGSGSLMPGDRVKAMTNLSWVLLSRFIERGDGSDLRASVNLSSAALMLSPPGDPNHVFSLALNGSALAAVYHYGGFRDDVAEQAIVLLTRALSLRDTSYLTAQPVALNLATLHKFRYRSDPHAHSSDLDLAIQKYTEVLDHCSPNNSLHVVVVVNLADALCIRGRRDCSIIDLTMAASHLHAALRLCRSDHPLVWNIRQTFGTISIALYEIYSLGYDADQAFSFFDMISQWSGTPTWSVLECAAQWVEKAQELGHDSLLKAYTVRLSIVDRHLSGFPTLSARVDLIRKYFSRADFSSKPAMLAVEKGLSEMAVELLEQGRGMLWRQRARIRTPLDQLRMLGEEQKKLADELENLNRKLQYEPQNRPTIDTRTLAISHEDESRIYRGLQDSWDAAVKRVREVDGFHNFLRPARFTELREAASQGPIIVLVPPYAGDLLHACALIITHSGSPQVMHLDMPLETMADILSKFCATMTATPLTAGNKSKEATIVSVLRFLWDAVVKPVAEKLESLGVPHGSRIWWCPTSVFSLFPVHAAGAYRRGEQNLSQLYVSSYTPTLSALILARQRRRNKASDNIAPSFISVGQEHPAQSTDEDALPSVPLELAIVQSLVEPHMPYTNLSDEEATADSALKAVKANSWVHFACHGKQDSAEPFKSCFAMGDRPLSLLDIIHADIEHAEFAFLSACHTASGGTPDMSDEVIHLAAGMQFSGYKSVVGTMWAVEDEAAVEMVSAFYGEMFKKGVDCRDAAVALHKALKKVDKKKVPLEQRIVFVHIGV